MLLMLPLTLISLALYNLIAFGLIGSGFGQALYQAQLMSGGQWTFTLGDGLIVISLIFLFFEVLKATRTGAGSILDHLLSTFVFIAFLVEFLLVAEAGTSVFFILLVIAFIDVVAGYSVSIRSARRDVAFGG